MDLLYSVATAPTIDQFRWHRATIDFRSNQQQENIVFFLLPSTNQWGLREYCIIIIQHPIRFGSSKLSLLLL